MKRRDFTLEQLKQYDGTKDQRILFAVNGKVFDATKGRRFYGPDGPYGLLAGHDATRALAKFAVNSEVIRDDYDDLADLTASEMAEAKEWEMQFEDRYPRVGRLLRPGEQATEYSDGEESTTEAEQSIHSDQSADVSAAASRGQPAPATTVGHGQSLTPASASAPAAASNYRHLTDVTDSHDPSGTHRRTNTVPSAAASSSTSPSTAPPQDTNHVMDNSK